MLARRARGLNETFFSRLMMLRMWQTLPASTSFKPVFLMNGFAGVGLWLLRQLRQQRSCGNDNRPGLLKTIRGNKWHFDYRLESVWCAGLVLEICQRGGKLAFGLFDFDQKHGWSSRTTRKSTSRFSLSRR